MLWTFFSFICHKHIRSESNRIFLLEIPNLVHTVSFYRDVLLNAVETLKQLIKRNNELRMSIDNVFIKISRPIFRKLDLVFKEGLKRVQWDTRDLATYFGEAEQVFNLNDKTRMNIIQLMVLQRLSMK